MTASLVSSSLHTCDSLSVCDQEFAVCLPYYHRTPHSAVGSRELGGICSCGNLKRLTAQGPPHPGFTRRARGDRQRVWTGSDSRQPPASPPLARKAREASRRTRHTAQHQRQAAEAGTGQAGVRTRTGARRPSVTWPAARAREAGSVPRRKEAAGARWRWRDGDRAR